MTPKTEEGVVVEYIVMRLGYGANCYIAYDAATRQAVVIDPGAQGKKISKTLSDNNLQLRAVFITHGHFDHVSGLKELLGYREERPDVWISRAEREIQEFPYQQKLLDDIQFRFWTDGEEIAVGPMVFTILTTPGHSPGSVCVHCEDRLFTGDTLFRGAIGRLDFPGGSQAQMIQSLKKIAALEGDLEVLPGHEASSQLEFEKRTNRYLIAITNY